MTDIVWEDPHGIDTRVRFDATRDELRKHPNRWARVRSGYKANPAGPMRAQPAWSGFELQGRRQEDGSYALFARYVGDEEV